MTLRLFVTGTDTGVGKTFVATALLAHARERGLQTAPLKPAETGCQRAPDGRLVPADGIALRAAAARPELPIDLVVPNRYLTPVAPAVAARIEGRPFSLEAVSAAAEALARGADLLVVEGAGGLLVPFSDELYAADVVRALAAPLIIVARAGLGTINHTLLTVFEARRRGLVVNAVVLNDATGAGAAPHSDPALGQNAAEIARLARVTVLGPVQQGARPQPALLDALLGLAEIE
jgi:dethiobiotin synthetase